MKASALLIAVAAAVVAALPAAAAADDPMCRNGSFPEEQTDFHVAEVTGSGPAHFLGDMDGCPSHEARCQARGYVVPGDRLLIGRTSGDFACAFYPGKGGGSAGWLPVDRLRASPPDAAAGPAGWVGKWTDGDNSISVAAKGGVLHAGGSAYWPSAHPPASVAPGGPNMGDFDGALRPDGTALTYKDDSCTVTLRRVGAWLVVADNHGCGGMNVSFTGVYGRR
jgi:hypothetical protein